MGTPDTEMIRGEIAAVRGEMDRTLEAIGRRLDVGTRARREAGRSAAALRRASQEATRPGPGPSYRAADLADRARRAEVALRGHPLAWAALIWAGTAVVLLLARLRRS